ncbi:cyclic nucleotide-gated ion channel 1-like [Rosa rugosa]|uniref:cyclic nucleotide-gated ion channel 1-like n=1 Tax=Rosa rugosa TaxID=74645 RepID=UPI002B40D319|nr:cyclic nucleotide-gated ion channel 1-like [Rosa rugosa]
MKENKQDPAQHSHTQGDAVNPSGGKDLASNAIWKEIVMQMSLGSEDIREHRLQTNVQGSEGTRNIILLFSCVIAVSVDPLFFYLPIINEEIKCVGVDKNLRTAALLLRAVTDIAFILNIFYEIKKSMNTARKMPWHSITIDILAVLPIPQVLMTIFFKMRSSKYLGQRKIIDVFLLAQYLPRIYRMHHSSQKFKKNKGVLIKGALYFFLYIIASHVLGGFWYFFSIQRETSCWHQACMKHSTSECNFYCDQDISSRNMTFISSLDEFCLVDVPANAIAPFHFGIFLDSLKSGNTGQINFAKKICFSFWWGLRNLSNFGTNLETSTYVWENCFAILTSTVGLLLFLYLIGKVQTFISMVTEKSEEMEISESRKRLSLTLVGIQLWMNKNGLNKETKNKITENVKTKWEKVKDADLENIFSILPPRNRISLKRFLCMKILRKLNMPGSVLKGVKDIEKKPGQENKDTIQEKMLTSICDFLKPVIYPDGRYVYRIGEPLDRMLLITDGLIWTYTTSISRISPSSASTSQDEGQGTGSTCLGKGAFYGDELLSWASDSLKSLDNLPVLKANAKAHGKVEGFVLMAKDLKVVVDKYKMYWGFPDSHVKEEAVRETVKKFCQVLKGKTGQQKVQPEHPKVLDVLPTSAAMAPPPKDEVVLKVRA